MKHLKKTCPVSVTPTILREDWTQPTREICNFCFNSVWFWTLQSCNWAYFPPFFTNFHSCTTVLSIVNSTEEGNSNTWNQVQTLSLNQVKITHATLYIKGYILLHSKNIKISMKSYHFFCRTEIYKKKMVRWEIPFNLM